MSDHDAKRRSFLQQMGYVTGATLVPGVLACGCSHSFFRREEELVNIPILHDPEFPVSNEDFIVVGPQPSSGQPALKEDFPLIPEDGHTHDDGNVESGHGGHNHGPNEGIQDKASSNPQDKNLVLKKKSKFFHVDFADDLFIKGAQYQLLLSTLDKIQKIQKHVGFGHFNIVDWEEGIRLAKRARGTGKGFSKEEVKFLEELFHRDAKDYGFMGEKVFGDIHSGVNRKLAIKIPYSGHYLVKGPSYEMFRKIRKDLGSDLVLTSGARGMFKQFNLFLTKVVACKGNASRASRSIAPPGYSFHGRGDFDIGSKALGAKNFTSAFAETKEYKKLVELGYVDIRYDVENLEGVRFEPWHIKVEV